MGNFVRSKEADSSENCLMASEDATNEINEAVMDVGE